MLDTIESLASLLLTGHFSDLTVTCRESIFRIHRVLMVTKSDFFGAACGGDFMVSLVDHLMRSRSASC